MGMTRFAILDANGNLVSVHDTEDAAIREAHAGGAARVFDRAGCLLSGPDLPEAEQEAAAPAIPAVRPWRPRDPDVARLLDLLRARDDEASDPDEAERRELIERLDSRGRPARLLRRFRYDGYGGYSIWGWRTTRLCIGTRTVAAWTEHFTAEAAPPACSWLTWYFSDGEETGGLNTLAAEDLLGEGEGGPEKLDQAIAAAQRQARRRQRHRP